MEPFTLFGSFTWDSGVGFLMPGFPVSMAGTRYLLDLWWSGRQQQVMPITLRVMCPGDAWGQLLSLHSSQVNWLCFCNLHLCPLLLLSVLVQPDVPLHAGAALFKYSFFA